MPRRAILLGILGLAAVAAAVFLIVGPSPRTVLRKAQRQLAQETSFRFDVEAALALPPQDLGGAIVPSATSVDIVLRTDLDRTDPLRHASVSTFSFVQGAGATERTLSGEARRADGRHYLKLDGTGDLSVAEAEALKGRWVASDRPFLDFIAPPDARDLQERPLDAAGLAAITRAFTGVDLFKVTGRKPDEKLGDVRTRRYAVEVDTNAVSALLLKLRELRTGQPVGAEDVLAVTAEIVRWGQPVGEVWIDRRTGKFLKIGLISAVDAGESSGAVGGTIVFSRYGEPVKVDVPQATELEEALGPSFSRRLSLAGDRAMAATSTPETPPKIPLAPGEIAMTGDADGDGLSDGQEHFYGADAWNPDTDGDGWNDGLEVEKGMSPLGPGTLFSFGL